MIDPVTDGTAFEPSRTIKHGSQTSTVSLENGKCIINTLGFETNVAPYAVERVIGEDPVRQFLTDAGNGRWQAHELSYDPDANDWFDVYGDEDRRPGEWGHWTGGGMNWNSRCADCHNTDLRKNYDEKTDGYHTTMAEISVGCEACHGPLKAHVEWTRAHPNARSGDPALVRSSPAQQLDTCGSCHARRDALTGNFKPGDRFFDHYSMDVLDDAGRWHADGQVADEDYEFASFLSSRMHQSGVTCQDCHDPHSGKTRLPGNNLCLRCHVGAFPKAPVIVPAEHTHHLAGSKGGECVGCHMPVTVYMQRQARHDHGFTIPDPQLTKELNIPNACNRCHADKDADWSLKYAEQWYGAKMERHTRERARWIAAAQRGDEGAANKMIGMLTGTNESPYWRAVAAGLLWRWAGETNAQTAVVAGLGDSSPLVREKAARALGEAEHPENIPALQQALNDQSRNVRVAAAWALKATVDEKCAAGKDLQASLDFDADQPTGQFHAAMFQLARQQPALALAHLQKGVEQDAYSPPMRFELAETLNAMGRTADALATLEQAEKLIPNDAEFPYARARILMSTGHLAEAKEAVQKALKLQPDFKDAQELLREMESPSRR